MKNIFSLFILFFCLTSAAGQKFSVALDRNNILYQGIDNPLTIAVENYPCNSIVVKTDNGKVLGKACSYYFHTDTGWKANIILYKKVKGHLIKIGSSIFRVKPIPDPIAKVGPSAGGDIQKAVLRNQQYIRADYEGFDIDIRTPIDSFSVYFISGDTCISKHVKNYTGKFSKELIDALSEIKQNDIVIFKDIYTTRYNKEVKILKPVFLFIKD